MLKRDKIIDYCLDLVTKDSSENPALDDDDLFQIIACGSRHSTRPPSQLCKQVMDILDPSAYRHQMPPPKNSAPQTETTAPEMLGYKNVATLLGCSRRKVERMNASGELPKPVKVGKQNRWPIEEFRRWCEAGCPGRQKWEGMK